MCSEILWCSPPVFPHFCAVSLNCLTWVPASVLGSGGQLSSCFSASPLIAKICMFSSHLSMHFWSIFFPALCSSASWMLSAGPNLARSDYLPLLSSCKMTSEVLCLVLGSPKGRDILKSIPEISQRVPTIYTEGWSRGCMRRSRRAVEMKKKWLGDLAAVYSYLMGGGREVKAKLFSKVHSESSRSSRHRLEQMKL